MCCNDMIGLFQKKDKVWGDLTVLLHDLRDTLKPLLFCSQGYSETCFSCRLKAIWEDSGAEGSDLFLSFYCSFCQLDLHSCTCALFNCFNPTTMAGAGESLFALLAQLVGSYCKGAADFTYSWSKFWRREVFPQSGSQLHGWRCHASLLAMPVNVM